MANSPVRVGFIGLGTMGRPMARNLLQAGFPLTFYARRPEVAAEFESLGALHAETPQAAAEQSDVLLSIVTADPQVRDIYLGPHGVCAGLREDSLAIDLSTIAPATARELAMAVSKQGAEFLDAPVSGGPNGAATASLAIMVGGSTAAYERGLPVLRALGKHLFHVGPSGAGQVVKLVNQLIGGALMTLIGEGLAIGRAAGVDLGQMADVVAVSSGASALFQARVKPFLLADSFPPLFTTALMRKDLQLALDLAQAVGVNTPVAGAAQQIYDAALAEGLGAADFSSVAKICAGAAGLSLAQPK